MSYTENFLKQLKEHAAELKLREPEHVIHQAHTAPYKPLTDQIIELMKSTPPEMLNRPWSMAELVARLDGKYRDRPHPQKVAHSLRLIRWNYRRYWKKGYNGVRVWLPPTEPIQHSLS